MGLRTMKNKDTPIKIKNKKTQTRHSDKQMRKRLDEREKKRKFWSCWNVLKHLGIIIIINLFVAFFIPIIIHITGDSTFEKSNLEKIHIYEEHLISKGFTEEQLERMTPLAKWLLAPEGSPPPRSPMNRTFLILAWSPMKFIKNRRETSLSTWYQCSAQNCKLSYDESDFDIADAVVFYLHLLWGKEYLPNRRRTDQRWIFMTEDTPASKLLNPDERLSHYNGMFNWSMTYRMDSDVPIPFGRTIQRVVSADHRCSTTDFFKKLWKSQRKSNKVNLAATMLDSNCYSNDNIKTYINKLKRYLGDRLDIIGTCQNENATLCPGNFREDCVILDEYKFYLSFEDNKCRDYITEKVFWNAYEKRAVPVIIGAWKDDCQQLLPPNSFIHVDGFNSTIELADYLTYLDRNMDEYLRYHKWRDNYKVLNEHNFFGSVSRHYCRICEALNYNPETKKIYDNLEDFWNQEKDCVPS